jgi:4-hydroxybenzoate polyprenyltransferase
MKKITNAFLFSSAFIMLCALSMVAQTADLFQLQNLNPFYFLFTAGGTMASYNLHWYFTDTNTNHEKSERYAWTHHHKYLLIPFAVTGILMAAVSFYFLKQYWLWIFISMVFTALYTAPKIPGRISLFLREIAIAKTIYLSLAWTYVTAILPLIITKQSFNFHTTSFIIHRYFFIYALCILFDYRDRQEDIKQRIRSLITILSDTGISILFYLSVSVSVCMAILFDTINNASIEDILLCIPLVIVAILFKKAKRSKNDYLYYFVIDGLMLLSFLLTSFQHWLSFLWQ